MPEPHMLRVLSAADVLALFDVGTAVASQRHAFMQLGLGHAQLPERLLLNGAADSISFCYAARQSLHDGAVSKFGSVNPGNSARGLPVVSALITVLDGDDGRPVAVMCGTSVTALRTPAASTLAASLLANPGDVELAILGTGVQGVAHVRAMATELAVSRVRMWAPHMSRCREVADMLGTELGIEVSATDTARAAVSGADIIVGCTSSSTPILEFEWLAPGALVISLGSFAPDRCEVPASLVQGADVVVVDHVPTAARDAGPIVRALADGALSASDLIPLGSVVAGLITARKEEADIIYYNSVGIGVQDAAAAMAILRAAQDQGRGHMVPL